MVKNRLKSLREAKQISMRQAARDLQMPYTTYVNYEKGTNEPNNEALVKLAVYYNVSADYLLGHNVVENKKSPPRTKREELQETLTPLLETLDVSQLEDLIKYVEYLIWLEEKEQS